MMLRKGSKVYVEANFELREPEPNTDPSTPAGQRQIFLRHGALLSFPHRMCFSDLTCFCCRDDTDAERPQGR